MSDELYQSDTLAWSDQQATLLRRLAAGERVNGVDWTHVVEEIEDVGKSALRACASLLTRAIEHLLKIHAWPASAAVPHWRSEAVVFRRDAARAWQPSMRRVLDITPLYEDAVEAVRQERIDGQPPCEMPARCPFDLDQLLDRDGSLDALLAVLRRAD